MPKKWICVTEDWLKTFESGFFNRWAHKLSVGDLIKCGSGLVLSVVAINKGKVITDLADNALTKLEAAMQELGYC